MTRVLIIEDEESYREATAFMPVSYTHLRAHET